jgi:hypothetical protein
MVDQTHAVTYEVVQRPNGRFAVLPVGGLAIPEDADEYETREEAEDALFTVDENLDDIEHDMPINKPGSGQAIR